MPSLRSLALSPHPLPVSLSYSLTSLAAFSLASCVLSAMGTAASAPPAHQPISLRPTCLQTLLGARGGRGDTKGATPAALKTLRPADVGVIPAPVYRAPHVHHARHALRACGQPRPTKVLSPPLNLQALYVRGDGQDASPERAVCCLSACCDF